MKTILVTGSEGYIGQQFIHHHRSRYNIITNDIESTTVDGLLHYRCDFAEILNKPDFPNVDAILHLAALAGFKSLPTISFFYQNMFKTDRLVDQAIDRDIKTFIYPSSQAVYSVPVNNPNIQFHEDSYCPPHAYSMSKLYSEESILKCKRPFIFRQATVIGKNVKDQCFGFLDKMCIAAIDNKKLTVTGADKKRSLILLEDLVKIYTHSIDGDGVIPPGIYNAAFISTTIGNAAKFLSQKLHSKGFSHELYIDNKEQISPESYTADGSKLQQFYEPSCSSLHDMIDITIENWIN